MSQFDPVFPRTVAGTEWRAPLSNPEIEAIAKRADYLYRYAQLSEDHRALMLVQYGRLIEASMLIDGLGRLLGDVSLRNDPGVRPSKPIKVGIASNVETISMAIGFALRLSEWVKRLEVVYCVQDAGCGDNGQVFDARTGSALPLSGDYI